MSTELNLKSINELPETEAVTGSDYLLVVQNGQGKRLPAGDFTGGGGGTDAFINATPAMSDEISLDATLAKGNYATLKAKLDSGDIPNVAIKLDFSSVAGEGCVELVRNYNAISMPAGDSDPAIMGFAFKSMMLKEMGASEDVVLSITETDALFISIMMASTAQTSVE